MQGNQTVAAARHTRVSTPHQPHNWAARCTQASTAHHNPAEAAVRRSRVSPAHQPHNQNPPAVEPLHIQGDPLVAAARRSRMSPAHQPRNSAARRTQASPARRAPPPPTRGMAAAAPPPRMGPRVVARHTHTQTVGGPVPLTGAVVAPCLPATVPPATARSPRAAAAAARTRRRPRHRRRRRRPRRLGPTAAAAAVAATADAAVVAVVTTRRRRPRSRHGTSTARKQLQALPSGATALTASHTPMSHHSHKANDESRARAACAAQKKSRGESGGKAQRVAEVHNRRWSWTTELIVSDGRTMRAQRLKKGCQRESPAGHDHPRILQQAKVFLAPTQKVPRRIGEHTLIGPRHHVQAL